MPHSEATQFLPVGTISEYQAYNKNRELKLFVTQLSVIDDKRHSFTWIILRSKMFTDNNENPHNLKRHGTQQFLYCTQVKVKVKLVL